MTVAVSPHRVTAVTDAHATSTHSHVGSSLNTPTAQGDPYRDAF